jgi:hypothetical protein
MNDDSKNAENNHGKKFKRTGLKTEDQILKQRNVTMRKKKQSFNKKK